MKEQLFLIHQIEGVLEGGGFAASRQGIPIAPEAKAVRGQAEMAGGGEGMYQTVRPEADRLTGEPQKRYPREGVIMGEAGADSMANSYTSGGSEGENREPSHQNHTAEAGSKTKAPEALKPRPPSQPESASDAKALTKYGDLVQQLDSLDSAKAYKTVNEQLNKLKETIKDRPFDKWTAEELLKEGLRLQTIKYGIARKQGITDEELEKNLNAQARIDAVAAEVHDRYLAQGGNDQDWTEASSDLHQVLEEKTIDPEIRTKAEELKSKAQTLSGLSDKELVSEYNSWWEMIGRLQKQGELGNRYKVTVDATGQMQTLVAEINRRGLDETKLKTEAAKKYQAETVFHAAVDAPPAAGRDEHLGHYQRILHEARGTVGELEEIKRLFEGDPDRPDSQNPGLVVTGHVFAPDHLRGLTRLVVGGGGTPEQREVLDRIQTRWVDVQAYFEEQAATIYTGSPFENHPTLRYWIAFFPKAADSYISRIIMEPFSKPRGEYEINLFTIKPNLDFIIQRIKTEQEQIGLYDKDNLGIYYSNLAAAAQYYHAMQKVLSSGKVDAYAQISPDFPTDYFDVVKVIAGVSAAKQQYEIAYRYMLNRDGRVDEQNEPEVRKLVLRALEDQIDTSLLTRQGQTFDWAKFSWQDDPSSNPTLEEWEMRRAVEFAASQYSIEVRKAEQVSMGSLADVNNSTSTPQESLTRMTNWFARMGLKFSVGAEKGGMWLMKKSGDLFRTLIERNFSWLNTKNLQRLAMINGVEVDSFELAGLFGVKGIWDGWRIEVGALNQIILKDFEITENAINAAGVAVEVDKPVTIYEYMNKRKLCELLDPTDATHAGGKTRTVDLIHKILSSNILDREGKRRFRASLMATKNTAAGSVRGKMWSDADLGNEMKLANILTAAKMVTTQAGMREMNIILEEVFTPLLENVSIGLGGMISISSLSHPNLYHVREMIWENIAEYDPQVMASMLSKLKFKDIIVPPRVVTPGMIAGPVASLDEILKIGFGYANGEKDERWTGQAGGASGPRVVGLREKMNLLHAFRMKNAYLPRGDKDINQKVVDQNRSFAAILTAYRVANAGTIYDISDDEVRTINVIQDQGRQIAQDLSMIRGPYAWFLDDIPFEVTNYDLLGSEFFSRRVGRDLPGFASAQKAWIEIVSGAYTLDPMKDGLKHFQEMTDSMAGILGYDQVQTFIVDPLFEAYTDFITEDLWAQQFLIDSILEAREIPTSPAQRYGGPKAPSYNVYFLADFIKEALHVGVKRTAGQGVIELSDGSYMSEVWDDNYEEYRRRKGTTFAHIILAFIRDFGIGVILTSPWFIGKRMIAIKAAA